MSEVSEKGIGPLNQIHENIQEKGHRNKILLWALEDLRGMSGT